MTEEGSFCLLRDRVKNEKVQLFLARLLALSAFTDLPRFCFIAEGSAGLAFGLAIGRAVSTRGEIAVGFLGYTLWKVLMSLQRCCTAEVASQVFSYSG